MDRKTLANEIWQACDIMRRDGGTSGVIEYMEQLSWLLFLKAYEATEERAKQETKAFGKEYKLVIERKYQWSSWAKKDLLAKELIEFIDRNLFPYLKSLYGTPGAEKIAMIFQELRGNRMKSGYNLKEVIEIINKIDFQKAQDSHVVSQAYEDLLLKMGQQGGIAGEFYTPRPIIRLMIKIVNPQIGETIFDPFCGSAGFLVESYLHLRENNPGFSVNDYETLQKKTFYGQEKKPLPFLLGTINMILHGIQTPTYIRTNTLEEDIRSVPEQDKYDIIFTNPPFGGKEGKNIQQNFPVRSNATELLALQYVARKLKVKGRCGIVVPEGILFRGTAFAKVKKELLENFNLHTIISLPSGVFANVSASGQGPKTNLLFFDRTGPTKQIWYYEHQPPKGGKYTKTNPIKDEHLEDCWQKWQKRTLSGNSWLVPVEEVVKSDFDLTAKNPTWKSEVSYKSPRELLNSIRSRENRIREVISEVNKLLG